MPTYVLAPVCSVRWLLEAAVAEAHSTFSARGLKGGKKRDSSLFLVWKRKVILRMGVEGKTNVALAVEGVWEERKWKSEGKGGEEEKHHKSRRGREGRGRPRPQGSAAGSPLSPAPAIPSEVRGCA